MSKRRCAWVTKDPIYIKYHDAEWGIPSYDDRYLFEMLCLEGAQAGLRWITILKRRENYRKAFDFFDPEIICTYGEDRIQALLHYKGIIRNELKIRSVITNATAFLRIQEEFGSFSKYIWQFVDGKPKINTWMDSQEVPTKTKDSEQMSRDLKSRGFSFVGPTICYAFMQAVGMVNDHEAGCFLHQKNLS